MIPNNPMQSYQNLITPMMPQGIIWVKGKNEAQSYPIARGTSMPIFDQESDCFYIKTVDVYGNTQPIRTFKYEEVKATEETAANASISVEDFNSLKNELAEMKEELKKALSSYKKPYRKENRNNGQ